MFIIGLTGGISCGKSAVAFELKKFGAVTFNVDDETNRLLQPDEIFYNIYVSHFGKNILDDSGCIDKKIIREIIFHNNIEREWINSVTHPILLNRTRDFLVESLNSGKNFVVLEIPLLFQAGWQILVDETWAVYLPEHLQLYRLVRRDKITAEQAVARIRAQMPVNEICKRADIVLKNSRSFGNLKNQIFNIMCNRWYSKIRE